MAITNTTVNLDQFETKEVAELKSYDPGTYLFKMMIRGNSLLSSVFLKSIPPGASVTFNYFDTTTGTENTPERYDLQGHGTFTSADNGATDRQVVTRIHNKPILEMIVSGGSVEVGAYVTVVTDFPAELATDGLTFATLPVLTQQTIENVSIASANVIQSHTFPANTKRYLMRARQRGKIQLHQSMVAQSPYITISPGAVYNSPDFNLVSKTIYFQSPVAGLEVELESWV